MKLLDTLLQHTQGWRFVFPQVRSLERAIALAFGILCGVGKRTLTRAISFHGNTQKDWSADYKVFSRSPWEPRALFDPILQQGIEDHQLERIVISTDDTRVWRNGKHVAHTQWHYDPMGPPFQINLRWGHRFLQASLVLPLYQEDPESSSRSVPVRFEIAPVVCKVPALLVAMYSWLLLAGLDCYGPRRTEDYEPLPKWRRAAKRPSCLDLVTLLRKQIAGSTVKFATAESALTYQSMVVAAAA